MAEITLEVFSLLKGAKFLALRVLREAEGEYGFKEGLYLNTALMIVEQMNGGVD
jgi:hypothetical protein